MPQRRKSQEFREWGSATAILSAISTHSLRLIGCDRVRTVFMGGNRGEIAAVSVKKRGKAHRAGSLLRQVRIDE
jgi:hypothetical protein